MKLFFRRLAAYVDYHRRIFAALAAALSVWCVTQSLGGPPPPESTVVVATHALTAGASVTGADVVAQRVPTSVVPDKALRAWPGRPCTAAAAVPRGHILTELTCVGPSSLTARPGRTLASVRLADANASELIRPGATIDVFGVTEQGANVLAAGGLVVSVPAKATSGFGQVNSGEQAIIVDVAPAEARDLAAAQGRHKLTATLSSG